VAGLAISVGGNFSNIRSHLKITWRHKGDRKQVPHSGPTNIYSSRPLAAQHWYLMDNKTDIMQHVLLRHCATNRKVAASIPEGVIGIFH
jgi:hypothetical protein